MLKLLTKNYQFNASLNQTVIFFGILGAFFLGFGIQFNVLNNNIKEVRIGYGSQCINLKNQNCQLQFTVPQQMQGNLLLFYKIENFYQNHRQYINSKSMNQLNGKQITKDTASTYCTNMDTNDKLISFTGISKAIDGSVLTGSEIAYPCGYIAATIFNDTFAITDNNNIPVSIDRSNLVDQNLKNTMYKNQPSTSNQWLDLTLDSTIVWMQNSGLPGFQKLYGKIATYAFQTNTQYTLTIKNQWLLAYQVNGEKTFILTNALTYGGKNKILEILYFVCAALSFLIAIIFKARNLMTYGKFGKTE